MRRFIFFTLFAALLSQPSFALELTEQQSPDENILLKEFKSSEHLVNDLLLFYDYDDLLVDAATRRPTKLKEIAENISLITAEEIRAMNIHSINEILRTVTGLQIDNRGGDFGAHGSFKIHAASYQHVLLLLDGVPLNDPDSGYPETGGIPVQIIDRIEIVKGPASSAYGSALGGVVNIVTKKAGSGRRPSGTIYGSYGDAASQDFRADAAGSIGAFHYYLYGGYMDSDGLVDDRYFTNKSFYAKFASKLASDVSLTFTAGYWYPDSKDFDWPEFDYSFMKDIENYLITGKLDAGISPEMKLILNLYFRSQEWHNHEETLTTGAFIEDQVWDNESYGGSAQLIREKDRHTMLLGADFSLGENDRTWMYPSAPAFRWGTEKRKDWSLYSNDTIKWKKLTITPGLRYDHLFIVDASSHDIISPSLGATYKITDDTLIRATAARGFIRPSIGLTVGSAGYPGYPDLEPEEIWSIQAGIESTRITNTHLKADVFYHLQDNTWHRDNSGLIINGGVSERTGVEFNATVSPFENFTSSLGVTYIWIEPYQEENGYTSGLNVKMNYSTGRFGSLTLFGRYVHWGEILSPDAYNGSYDDTIWDLHYNKDIYTRKNPNTALNLFFSGRNLFNGAIYSDELLKNPGRWFESGVRINF